MAGDQQSSFFSAGNKRYEFGGAINDSCIQFNLENKKGSLPKDENGSCFTGLVAQSLQVQIGRQVQTLYELGSTKYYVVNGKPSGNGSLTNVIGPNTVAVTSLKDLGDVCYPTTITINKVQCMCANTTNNQPEAKKAGDDKYIYTGGFLTGVGVSLQATSFAGQGTWSFSFQDFQCA